MAALHTSTFDGTDGTQLASYTPELGAAWTSTRDATDTVLSSNRLRFVAAGDTYVTTDVGDSDVTLSAEVTLPTAVNGDELLDVLLRYSDTDNHFFVRLSVDDQELQLWKRESGSNTLLDSVAKTIAVATQYTVEVEAVGNDITATCGAEEVSASSSFNSTAELFGAHCGQGPFPPISSTGYLDTFSVESVSLIVTAGVITVDVTAHAPAGPLTAQVGVATVSVTAHAPDASTGIQLAPAAIEVAVSAHAPTIEIGAAPGSITVTATAHAPGVLVGVTAGVAVVNIAAVAPAVYPGIQGRHIDFEVPAFGEFAEGVQS